MVAMTATIDTHEGVKRLIGAGFTEHQAEQTVQLLADWSRSGMEQLVTKDHLGLELEKIRKEIIGEMAAMERRMVTLAVASVTVSITILGILIAVF